MPTGAPASTSNQKLPSHHHRSSSIKSDSEAELVPETHPLLSAPPARIDVSAVTSATTQPSRRHACRAGSFKITLVVCFVLAAAYGLSHFNTASLQRLFAAVQADPKGSLLFFWAFYVVGIVFMLPGMVLAVGAGAVYGFATAIVIIWTATCIGQTLAFLFGRYLFRDFIASWLIQKVENFAQIEEAVAREGWKLVFLLRLSPLIPYNLLNYILSVTPVHVWSFAIPSGLAIIPWVCGFAYIGSVSSNVVDVVQGTTSHHMNLGWLLASLVGLFAIGCATTIIAKKAINNVMEERSSSKREPPETTVIEMAASEAYGVKA